MNEFKFPLRDGLLAQGNKIQQEFEIMVEPGNSNYGCHYCKFYQIKTPYLVIMESDYFCKMGGFYVLNASTCKKFERRNK